MNSRRPHPPIITSLLGAICLALVMMAAASVTLAADASERGYLFGTKYRPEEFGGTAPVFDIAQVPGGLIYAAKHDGVLEFDGSQWRLIEHPQQRGFHSLAVDAAGRVFVGCKGDFGVLEPDEAGVLRYRSLKGHLPTGGTEVGQVESVIAHSSGIYFQTAQALYRWRESASGEGEAGAIHTWREPNSFNKVALIGERVVVARGGFEDRLLVVSGDKLTALPGSNTIRGVIMALAPIGDDGVLVGTADEGLFRYQTEVCATFDSEAHDFAKEHNVWAIEPIGGDRYAVATNSGGVAIINQHGEVSRVLNDMTGLDNNAVYSALLDREQGLWLGSIYGLLRFEINSPLEFFNQYSGLHGTVNAMQHFNGRFYVATPAGCFVLKPTADPGRPARFTELPSVVGNCQALAVAGGKLLVGANKGLYEITVPTQVEFHAIPGISQLLPAQDGDIVFAGTFHDGVLLLKQDNGAWIDEGRVGKTSDHVREMIQDSRGRLWLAVGTDADFHLERVDNPADAEAAHVTVYGEAHGFSPARLPRPLLVRGEIYIDALDAIYRYEESNDRFVTLTAEELGLQPVAKRNSVEENQNPRIFSAVLDANDQLWIASMDNPVVRFPNSQRPPQPVLPLQQAGRRRIRRLYADPNGAVWAWAMDGILIRHDGSREIRPVPVAAPLIRHVTCSDGNTLLAGRFCQNRQPLQLPFSQRTLNIDYAVPRFAGAHAVRYQTRMVGLDDHWSNWDEQPMQRFPALREGDYRFEVRMRDDQLRISPVASLDLKIAPPWYRTWSAYLGCAVGLCLGVYGLLAWRLRIIRATVSRLQREIAAREQAQLENEALQFQLLQSQKLDALGTLAAGVAHDFNNALAAIVTYAELAVASLPKGTREVEFTEGILRAARQATSTTKGLLTFSRSTASEKRPTDLGALVTDSINFLRRLLPASIRTTVESPKEAPVFCQVDDTQIQQVLMNLVVNARDAMPEGGELAIRVEHDPTSLDWALMTVRDTGRGMSEDVRAKMFEPFFTTKSRGQGTGLGMSIVHGIISEHGGSIDVDSMQGSGSTIRIRLPKCAPSETAGGPPVESFDGAGMTVVLAEDNANVRESIALQLQGFGFQVLEAQDGEQALALVAKHNGQVDLVILDVDMPKKSGVACVREIHQRAPSLPAILISGVPTVEVDSLDAGFLKKPIEKAALVAAVRTQLERKTAQAGEHK